MLNLVRAFNGAPASTFHCLSLPTESLLVSPISPPLICLTRTIFPALRICRHSGYPRCRVPPPRPFASLFSSLSWPRSRGLAYHIHCSRLPVEARTYFILYRKCFPLYPAPLGRWSRHPARGLPFGPSLGSLLALGSSTRHSFFLMTSTSQLLTVAQVSFISGAFSLSLLTQSRSFGRRDAINDVRVHFDHGE